MKAITAGPQSCLVCAADAQYDRNQGGRVSMEARVDSVDFQQLLRETGISANLGESLLPSGT